ncbi:tRNA nuclease WapA-like [Ptychodera flava]|uniref:tRNA nuclease WapA-like n=1 Tax=Ptychodera flava TaxID=63121 RepID=UPI00396A6094
MAVRVSSVQLLVLFMCISGTPGQDNDCDYPDTPVPDDSCKWVNYDLPNADFEDQTNMIDWFPIPTELFKYTTEEAHSGMQSIEVELESSDERGGAFQIVQFDEGSEPTKVVFQGWSKAKDVSGVVDKYYSLECRATNTLGVEQGIYNANFTTGNQDWNMQEIYITADPDTEAITKLVCTCLFQFKTGIVYFDDMSLILGYDCETQ